uniref:Histone-lysine N-methyltransferase ATX2 n=1 Tax=Anthurium amnicola TaxID=1678845 RepID=A0A1D1Z907_9ARAE
MALSVTRFVHEEEETDKPTRYVHIKHLYSSTSPCINASGASNVMSKKVKARKVTDEEEEEGGLEAVQGNGKGLPFLDPDLQETHGKPPEHRKPVLVYHRRAKRHRHSWNMPSFFDSVTRKMDLASRSSGDAVGDGDDGLPTEKKQKRMMKYELLGLGAGAGFECGFSGPRLRASRWNPKGSNDETKAISTKGGAAKEVSSSSGMTKRWVELSLEDADPFAFVGLMCKVFWPIDDEWYMGSVTEYNAECGLHRVLYNDGDTENLNFLNERIKFYISRLEMQSLKLKHGTEKEVMAHDEMLAMAAILNDCQDLEPGDLVWAKLTGHAMWPAVVIDEAYLGAHRILKTMRRERAVSVQFFGTHDFARINVKHVVPFLNGAASGYHLKCKQKHFRQSLEEAKIYLCKQQLPTKMLRQQRGAGDFMDASDDEEGFDSGEDTSVDEGKQKMVEYMQTFPLEIGDLSVLSLGNIVCDSQYFHNKSYIWPEGYTALRKFISIADPNLSTSYKMEVLRNPKSKFRPLFRVTLVDGEQIDGSNPNACWRKIYSRIQENLHNNHHVKVEECKIQKTGFHMFGFSNPKISYLIQELANSGSCLKYSHMPAGYRPINFGKDLDRCDVCHMDEEYEDNLFLQCDKCRMMVHARCYGELGPKDGSLWHCNLCRPGAPGSPPICCLCPVAGGAIKPTTDGRWAHLTCAIWIPETCLRDVKKMEPIDGLSRINKDRWKLLCSICGVPYGACIQCSNSTCRVAYHPLCARSNGLCVEPEDVDRLHLMSPDEDDDECIRLLSFCKKHRQPSNECAPADECLTLPAQPCSTHVPPSNPSGCARSEPYNFFGRRGQREPQVLTAASVKRLFVENSPYLVRGYRQNGVGFYPSCNESGGKLSLPIAPKFECLQDISPGPFTSIADKYVRMKATFRKRLAFGKSRIHGFGVFAKLAHKAGDMVIEYTGELVRPPIADIREHLIYNSLVGAGTYMFRIDDERVIDATKAGSIAQLINHSCEPNCYSRVISVNGDEHIIIFAKRDIKQWEELTYDYRFFSIDEQLTCYCGFQRCRGVVNDVEAEERVAKIWVSRSELISWGGE